MRDIEQLRQDLKPYMNALPDIFDYQILIKILLAILMFVLGRLFQALLKSAGRVALTSGDWEFLFTTWQGLLILILGLVSLFIYVACDLNTKIVISRNLVTGQEESLVDCLKEGFSSIGKLLNLRGALVALYIALIAPILGIGLSISLTEGLYIPTFISSVIQDSMVYSALAGAAVLLFLSVGIANMFILHGTVIDGLSVPEASAQSRELMKANWKDYVWQNLLFIVLVAGTLAVVAVLCLFLPLKLISMLALPAEASRLLTVFFVLAGVIISTLASLLGTPLYLLKTTQLFCSYKEGRTVPLATKRRDLTRYKAAALVAVAAVLVVTYVVYDHFDQMFPLDTNVRIIAHRAGGNEGAENTLSGLEAAWNAGAYGSEIDIQRTKDGYYVVNHDATFKRVANDPRKPGEMTLREVKRLSVDGESVPTFEEMLIASRGRIILFTELKGDTADRQMADDAVALIKQYQMEDEVVLISLKYDLIDYIEKTYPEMQTGFLLFASFGNTAQLNCDYIGLEEESATSDAIRSVHDEGKKVLVWTANSTESQKHFLCTDIDGLITDNVSQAIELVTVLENRSDLDRMIDTFKTLL